MSDKKKIEQKIFYRRNISNKTIEEFDIIERKVIATYDEAIENGIQTKLAYNMAISDLNKFAPIDYEVLSLKFNCRKKYFIFILSLVGKVGLLHLY